MGGSIAIAARFNDGQAICVDGWTNFIPNMVMNAATLSGDDRIVRDNLMECAQLSSYGGPQPFRAHGYGIVVIDFVAREIHSMQGYTGFRHKILLQLSNMKKSGWQGMKYVNVLSSEAEGLLDAGRISVTRRGGEDCEPELLDRKKALKLLDADTRASMTGATPSFIELTIDTAPFKVVDYEEGGSLTAMKKRLAEVGFPMTKAEGLNNIFKQLGKRAILDRVDIADEDGQLKVQPVWKNVDRPSPTAYCLPYSQRPLAERFQAALATGQLFEEAKLHFDVYGKTYIAAPLKFRYTGGKLDEDLTALDF